MSNQVVITEQFKAARGDEADATWAATALVQLAQADVAPRERQRALDEALGLVRSSGESAAELFGDPVEWGREKASELAEQGADFVRTDTDLPTGASVAVVLAGVYTLLLAGISAIKHGLHQQWSVALVLAPALLAVLTMLSLTVWERARASRPLVVASLVTAAVVLGGAGLTAAIFFATGTDEMPLGRHSTLWWLPLLALWSALAWGLGSMLPAPREQVVRVETDEQWLAEARAALRERGDRSEADIEARLAEARQHAEATGRPLLAEFGNPRGYPTLVPVDQARATFRGALLPSAAALVYAVLLGSSWREVGWWQWALLAVLVLSAASAWRRHLVAGRSR